MLHRDGADARAAHLRGRSAVVEQREDHGAGRGGEPPRASGERDSLYQDVRFRQGKVAQFYRGSPENRRATFTRPRTASVAAGLGVITDGRDDRFCIILSPHSFSAFLAEPAHAISARAGLVWK